jgi:hypothetical protein
MYFSIFPICIKCMVKIITSYSVMNSNLSVSGNSQIYFNRDMWESEYEYLVKTKRGWLSESWELLS